MICCRRCVLFRGWGDRCAGSPQVGESGGEGFRCCSSVSGWGHPKVVFPVAMPVAVRDPYSIEISSEPVITSILENAKSFLPRSFRDAPI